MRERVLIVSNKRAGRRTDYQRAAKCCTIKSSFWNRSELLCGELLPGENRGKTSNYFDGNSIN